MNQLLYPQIQFPISYTRYVLSAEQIVPASISNNLRAVCACALAVQTRAKYCPPVGLGKAQSAVPLPFSAGGRPDPPKPAPMLVSRACLPAARPSIDRSAGYGMVVCLEHTIDVAMGVDTHNTINATIQNQTSPERTRASAATRRPILSSPIRSRNHVN